MDIENYFEHIIEVALIYVPPTGAIRIFHRMVRLPVGVALRSSTKDRFTFQAKFSHCIDFHLLKQEGIPWPAAQRQAVEFFQTIPRPFTCLSHGNDMLRSHLRQMFPCDLWDMGGVHVDTVGLPPWIERATTFYHALAYDIKSGIHYIPHIPCLLGAIHNVEHYAKTKEKSDYGFHCAFIDAFEVSKFHGIPLWRYYNVTYF